MGDNEDPIAMESALFEALPLAAFVHGPMTVIDVNAAGCELLEATDSCQVVGSLIRDFVHPDVHEAGEARRELLLKHGQRLTGVPVKLLSVKGSEVRAQGAAVPFTVGANPLAVAIATPTHATTVLNGGVVPEMPHFPQDTPVRTATLKSLPLPVVAMRGATIVYANPAACGLMCAPDSEDLIGHSVLEFVHADMLETLAERLELGIISASADTEAPGKITTLNGETRCIRARACVVEDGPEPLRAWVVTGISQ